MDLRLSEYLHPGYSDTWGYVKQCGVEDVVTSLDGAEQDQRIFAFIGAGGQRGSAAEHTPWSVSAVRQVVDGYAEYGLTVRVVEDTPPLDLARIGAPGRDQQIENVLEQIEAMRQAEIPVLCYNWAAVSGWARTDAAIPGRGGALVTGFRASDAAELPLLGDGAVTHDQLWAALEYFLDAVMPVAEAAGIRLAMHPDDPPLPVMRGVPRILSTVEGFRRLIALNRSPANAITLCQGNFALMTDDIPGLIAELGDRIGFIHFRDVRGTADDFVEVFHDEGQTDMAACLRAYDALNYEGALRPDHVPTMLGETNDRPGYGNLGRLFALGYVRGLLHGIA